MRVGIDALVAGEERSRIEERGGADFPEAGPPRIARPEGEVLAIQDGDHGGCQRSVSRDPVPPAGEQVHIGAFRWTLGGEDRLTDPGGGSGKAHGLQQEDRGLLFARVLGDQRGAVGDEGQRWREGTLPHDSNLIEHCVPFGITMILNPIADILPVKEEDSRGPRRERDFDDAVPLQMSRPSHQVSGVEPDLAKPVRVLDLGTPGRGRRRDGAWGVHVPGSRFRERSKVSGL